MSNSKKITIIIPVWGKTHIDKWIKNIVPTYFASGNIPYLLKKGYELDVILCGELLSSMDFKKSLWFQEFYNKINFKFIDIFSLIKFYSSSKSSLYGIILTKSFYIAMNSYKGKEALDRYFIFLNADFSISNNFFAALEKRIREGQEVVIGYSLRVLDTAAPLLQSKYRTDGPVSNISISPSKMIDIFLKYPHPTVLFSTTTSKNIFVIQHQIYDFSNKGIITCYHALRSPILLKPSCLGRTASGYFDYNLIFDWAPKAQIYWMNDSREGVILEFEDEEKEMEFVCDTSSLDYNKRFAHLAGFSNALHLKNALQEIKLHSSSKSFNPQSIKYAKDKLDEYKEFIKSLKAAPYLNHPFWVYAHTNSIISNFMNELEKNFSIFYLLFNKISSFCKSCFRRFIGAKYKQGAPVFCDIFNKLFIFAYRCRKKIFGIVFLPFYFLLYKTKNGKRITLFLLGTLHRNFEKYKLSIKEELPVVYKFRAAIQMTPKITIITTSYNYAEFLEQAIQSVVHQTCLPDEYIIIDDASTDESVKIIKRYESLKFVKVIYHKKNKGVLSSLNEGLKVATGDFILFNSADDFLKDSIIAKYKAFLSQNSDVGFCCALSDKLVVESNKTFQNNLPRELPTGYVPPLEAKKLIYKHGAFFFGNTVLLNRKRLVEHGGFNEKFLSYTDGFLYISLALKYGFIFINESLATYRKSNSSYSKETELNPIKVREIGKEVLKSMNLDPISFDPIFIRRWHRRWGYLGFNSKNMTKLKGYPLVLKFMIACCGFLFYRWYDILNVRVLDLRSFVRENRK